MEKPLIDPYQEPEPIFFPENTVFTPEDADEFPFGGQTGGGTAHEKYAAVVQKAGFSPRSLRELGLASECIEFLGKPGGFGSFLNKVLLHQNKSASDDPTAALRRIMHEIVDYAESTRGDQTMVEQLLDDLPSDGLTTLGVSSTIASWKDIPSVRRALGLLTFEQRMQNLDPDDPILDLSSPNDDEIEVAVRSMTSSEAKIFIDSITKQNKARREFWVEAIKSARSHSVVKAIADTALSRLIKQD